MEGLQAGVEYGRSKRTTVLTVGYGRIGKALLPRLTSLGCRVLTAERRQDRREDAAQICGMAIPIEDLGRVRADAIFNTVPSRVIPPSLIRDSIYIELASAPFGISPQEGREIARVYRSASGLPGKYAPYRAGLALWNYLRSEWEATV